MNIEFLKVLENEIQTCYNRGANYSLVNSDWTVSLNYVTGSVYHRLFDLYIPL